MNVIMALEDEFGQEADIEQILELQTVQQLVDYLLSLLQQPKYCLYHLNRNGVFMKGVL